MKGVMHMNADLFFFLLLNVQRFSGYSRNNTYKSTMRVYLRHVLIFRADEHSSFQQTSKFTTPQPIYCMFVLGYLLELFTYLAVVNIYLLSFLVIYLSYGI